MPGTYEKSDGTVAYNPSAPINAIFPALYSKQNFAYSHAERKILISLYYLFGGNIEDLEMTMISNREFCPACQRMIINFVDIYKQSKAISEDFYGQTYIDNTKCILILSKE